MRQLLFVLVVLLAFGATTGVYLLMTADDSTLSVRHDDLDSEDDAPKDTRPPEKRAEEKMRSLEKPAERIKHLEWAAKQKWANSRSPIFKKTIVSDPSEEVQVKALDVAIEMAKKEWGTPTTDVILSGLASPRAKTQQQAGQ